jgi:ferrous iron transport protein B
MKLSDLKNGQKAVISKINGSGAFRQRIIEMGFIEGKEIEAIKRAPLMDPAEYSLMGYSVTLRKKEADMIEICEEGKYIESAKTNPATISFDKDLPGKETSTIRIALVGNPNCGKTTIFNFASNSHERVANYTGVTVAAKEATAIVGKQRIDIVDLPGTYSLSSYSPEEIFVIDFLTTQHPDVIVNVIDASNLERNLFLTTQLMDLGMKVVIALNMYDELESNGDKLNYKHLSDMIGIPIIPTIGTKGKGIEQLFKTIAQVHKGEKNTNKRVVLNYGQEIDDALSALSKMLEATNYRQVVPGIPARFIALKLIDNDPLIKELITKVPDSQRVLQEAERQILEIEKIYQKSPSNLVADARYGFIAGALKENYAPGTRKLQESSQKADKVITNKLLGIPIFFALIWLTFYATFKIGAYPVVWIESFIGFLSSGIEYILPNGLLHDLLIDGIIGGVGGVIVFLPSIMILFLFISLMEDTGYMARTAFLMDKAMHKMGLHGKSFIPLLMGFGCNVPAVMATRTLESKRDRILTMMAIPFMSCSARLPVYVLFISAFFPVYKGTILFSIYLIGVLAAFFTAVILNKTVFRKIESPFVMELPPYRMPTVKAITKHVWFKTSFFLKKMGTIILLASIIIWALGYFPRNSELEANYKRSYEQTTAGYNQKIMQTSDKDEKDRLSAEMDRKTAEIELQYNSAHLEQSFISRLGKFISPVFEPLGFDWKMSVSILTGVLAKEIVVSSMGVIYHADSAADESSVSLISKLQDRQKETNTPLYVYFGFLVFILLYFPCIGTLTAIRKETGNFSWMLFETLYTTGLAWIAAFGIFSIGNLIS